MAPLHPFRAIFLVKTDKATKLDRMRRLIPLLLMFVSAVSLAESGEYRIEMIVFRNLDLVVEPGSTVELRRFSQFPDSQGITASPAEETEGIPESIGEIPQPLLDTLTGGLPDELTILDGKSAYMDDVWRRLRGSKAYRPLLFTAWQQNRVDYYPPMRVHDQSIIDTQFRPPASRVLVDLTAEDPLADYRSDFYQLDGTMQLRRSRFLHVYLDLVHRQLPEPAGSANGFVRTNDLSANPVNNPDVSAPGDSIYNIYTLKQNRQVKTGQLEYFDTPFLGALVFVTAISDP